ncbi:MAG: peroxiredoxin, partial [bacterium]|nr:peroxiredoxin [bacterium]
MLKIGQEAPDFTLFDQNGNQVSLSNFKGKQNVVIFFYPKDNTPGCTAQSCSFRDNYVGFKSLNTQVLGISDDSTESHQTFSQKNRLTYPILSDEKGVVREKYGLKKFLGFLPSRTSFAINAEGKITAVFSSQLQVSKHIDEML